MIPNKVLSCNFPPLRPFQKEALELLSHPKNTKLHLVCVAPTGSGKSLIYEQFLLSHRIKTLFITPLIALGRQQNQRLSTLGIPVAFDMGGSPIPSPFSKKQVWILSPEKLLFQKYWNKIQNWQAHFLVIDECHCLWEWGDSFRPAFSIIPKILKNMGIFKSLWLTATLPFPARLQLRSLLPNPLIERGEFALPSNVYVSIQQIPLTHRIPFLIPWLKNQKGTGILFVPTRNDTLRLGRVIEASGQKVICYHAGMSSEERQNAEKSILELLSKNTSCVIIATSAFGLGMNYTHLNYVVLWQTPFSLLALVQAIGRAGRNAHQMGFALILWDREDFQLLEWTIKDSQNSPQKHRRELIQVLNFLEKKECREIGLKKYFHPEKIELRACGHCDYCSTQKNAW